MERPITRRTFSRALDTLEFEIISELMADAAGVNIDKPGHAKFRRHLDFRGYPIRTEYNIPQG